MALNGYTIEKCIAHMAVLRQRRAEGLCLTLVSVKLFEQARSPKITCMSSDLRPYHSMPSVGNFVAADSQREGRR